MGEYIAFRPFGGNMLGGINTSKGNTSPESSEKAKKRWLLNVLILAGIFLLSVVLPPDYKVFAPLLFIIPFIINAADKIRQAAETPENSPGNRTYSPSMPRPDRMSSPEPYTYKPKDSKDPRRYKPIG